jgi:hypothetical protein
VTPAADTSAAETRVDETSADEADADEAEVDRAEVDRAEVDRAEVDRAAADRADADAVTQLLPRIMAAAEEAVRAKTITLPTIPQRIRQPDAAPNPAQPKVPPLPPDDSPTVVDMIPSFAIVDADAATRLDSAAAKYRGARRRPSLTSYPIGAVVVAAVILLITLTVALQLFGGSEPKNVGSGEPLFRAQTPPPPVATLTTATAPTPGAVSTPAPTYVGGGGTTPVVPGGPGGTRPGGPAVSTSPSPVRTSTVPTSGPPAQPKTGAIVGINGKCAEVTYYGQVQLNSCNGGSAQRWTVQTDGTVRTLGGCLDVRNSATVAGTTVQLFECNRTAAQQWRWRTDGTLLNPNSSRCLDAENGNSTNGTRLIIWDCHGRQNQVWRLV